LYPSPLIAGDRNGIMLRQGRQEGMRSGMAARITSCIAVRPPFSLPAEPIDESRTEIPLSDHRRS
jgi:hypothetical protein